MSYSLNLGPNFDFHDLYFLITLSIIRLIDKEIVTNLWLESGLSVKAQTPSFSSMIVEPFLQKYLENELIQAIKIKYFGKYCQSFWLVCQFSLSFFLSLEIQELVESINHSKSHTHMTLNRQDNRNCKFENKIMNSPMLRFFYCDCIILCQK